MESRTHTRRSSSQDRARTGASDRLPTAATAPRADPAPDSGELVVDMGATVRALFEALGCAGVRFVVLRHHHGLPDVLTKRDLSLMLHPRDSRLFARVFAAVCGQQGFVVLRNPRRRNAVALTAIRFEPGADGTCHERILGVDARLDDTFEHGSAPGMLSRFRTRVFFDMLRTRPVTRGGCTFPILDRRDEFLFLLKHWKRKQAETTRDELLELLEDPELAAWARRHCGGAYPLLGDHYSEKDDALVAILLAARWGAPTGGRTLRAALRAARNRLAGWSARVRPTLAPLIYFSGPDGCGKSTIAVAATRTFEQWKIPHAHLYSLKKYLRYITHRLAWLKHRAGGARPATEPTAPFSDDGDERWADPSEFSDDFRVFRVQHDHADRDTGNRAWRVRKWLALVVGAADIFIGWVMALGYRIRGRAVIVETSPYELFIKYHMPEFPWTERLLARLLPQPTLGVLVRVDPARLVARKAELTRREVEDYYARLDVVLRRAHANDRFIEAANDGTLGETHAQVMPALFATLAPGLRP